LSTEFGPPPAWDEATLKSRVASIGMLEYNTYEGDVLPGDSDLRKRLRPSVFPPTPEEVAQFGLEKCLRCMPHDMDTGGFFVALFKKVKEMPSQRKKEARVAAKAAAKEGKDDEAAVDDEDEDEPVVGEDEDDEQMQVDGDDEEKPSPPGKPPKEQMDQSHPMARKGKEDEYYPSTSVKWESLVEYYGLSEDFPVDQCMVRSTTTAKSIYFISKPVKGLLFDSGLANRKLMIIHTGLKAFERNTNEGTVDYRISQEGVHFVLPYMTTNKFNPRRMVVSLEDFKASMQIDPFLIANLKDDTLKERIRALTPGCFVMVLEGYEKEYAKKMIMVMWRCRGDRLNCLVNKVEIEGMQSKIRCIEGVPLPSASSSGGDDGDKSAKNDTAASEAAAPTPTDTTTR